jgi:ankyrin repeat protein
LRLANNLQNKSQSGVATEKDLHGLLCSLTNEGAGVVLIVDGFDECHEYESEHHKRCRLSRQRFLQQLFSAFVGTSSRLIMVSRDEDDLRSAFCTPGQDTLLEHVVDHGITTTDVHVDIQRFCYAQVDSNPRLSQQPDDLRNDVLDHLINGSDGMFLFASLQCALLAQAKNAAQLRRRMEDIPRDLDSFYEQYWQRIMDSDDLEQKRVLRILRWVTFAAEPLTVPALFEAIALQAQNGKLDISQEWLPMQNISERVARTDLLDACRPFLVLRRSNTTESFATTTVQLCHFSMKAFLAERLRIPEQKKLSATKDPILAELCVGYLAAGIPWKPLISTDPCLQSHPLLSYALFNLTQHFERDDSTFTSAHKLLLEFYDPANQNWIKWRDENERQTSKLHRHMSLNGRPGGRCYYAAAQGLDFVLDQLLADDADAINIVGGAYGTPLQVACSKGLVSTVTVLLRHSAAVNLTAGIHGTALHAAVAADVLAIVEALLTHEADASAMNASGRTALLEAVWREHWSIVPCLISASQHVDLACPFGNTPLSIAAQKGHQETIESLVKSGACVNPDSRLVNPLHAACRYAKVAAATLLLRLGANADSLDSKNRTPLIVAAESGNYAMTRVLLNAGASPHIVAADGWRALPLAAKNGHSKVVRALIDHRADFAATGPDGRTPFLLAVEHGLLETVQIFIDMKADPVALCSSKSSGVRLSTVYHKAASNDNLELVQAFLDAGLELAYTDSSGDTLLHSAAADGCLRTASGLLGRSADPTMKNQKDRCSLCGAAIGDHTAVVRLLLEHVSRHPDCEDLIGAALVAGAYANSIASVELLGDAAVALGIAHEKIQHAMVEAAGRGEIGIVRLLLARGACVALPDTSGRTSLCMAASRGEPRMVEFLLASGACPNRADRNGMTPLHIAAEAGHSVVVKVLLHGGSQTDRMAKGYLTPLGMAMQRKHVGIIRLLMDQGADAHIICETCDSRLLYYSRFRLVVVREIPLAERVGHTVQWRDQRGRSLIHLAAAQGRACCVEASVKLGISVNMADGQKRTPLHWAAHFGHELVVDQLVNLGADVSLTDQQHRLSADLAAISGYAALAASLNRLYRRKIRRRASVALETDAGEDCWPET